MKKLILVVIAISVIGMAGAVMAADNTTTVDVVADVVGNCRFSATGFITFTIVQAAGGDVHGTVWQPVFACTSGTNYRITDDNGLYENGAQHRMKHVTHDEYIPYSFTYTAEGQATGGYMTMDITSVVKEADYINARIGQYTDIVTLTITP